MNKPHEWLIKEAFVGDESGTRYPAHITSDLSYGSYEGNMVHVIEKEAYDVLNAKLSLTEETAEEFQRKLIYNFDLYEKEKTKYDALLKSNAELLRALEEILHASNMATLGKWDDTEIMKNLAYKALTEYAELMRTSE